MRECRQLRGNSSALNEYNDTKHEQDNHMTEKPRETATSESVPMPAFDHVGLVRSLLGEAKHGALATLTNDGAPFSTLIALALDADGAPIIITSHLSGHTGHMERDGRVSVLISSIGKGDPLAHPRVTLVAHAVAARRDDAAYDRLRARYLTANPKAELYVDLPGFWFWRLEPISVALNGGFGKAWYGPWSEVALLPA
jgi:heme iron utilization protein